MDQREIYRKLHEVVDGGVEEFIDLSGELSAQLYRPNPGASSEDWGRHHAYTAALDSAVVSAYMNDRKLLPQLFPVVALLCGDREEGKTLASIDWSIVEAE